MTTTDATDIRTALDGAVFDGAMGTLLQDRGLEGGVPAEAWNLEQPERVRAAHEQYVAAGARVLTTNTFGGSRARLQLNGLGDRVGEVNEAAARIARQAGGADVLVAGDLGPTGELLEPIGALTTAEAASYFAEQAAGLAAGGVDLFLIETISDLAELEAAVAGIRSVAADAPIIATMSFDTNLRTMMGVKPADAIAKGIALGLVAVGANCGRGPVEMEQIAAEMVGARGDADILLIAQSNAGLPHLVGDHFEYDAGPEVMAAHASALRALGIDVIGACCGSTPEHLTAMTQALAADAS